MKPITSQPQPVRHEIPPFYSGCQKNVPIAGRFFVTTTYAAIIFPEHIYDKRYKRQWTNGYCFQKFLQFKSRLRIKSYSLSVEPVKSAETGLIAEKVQNIEANWP
jgi:hypothetical protein